MNIRKEIEEKVKSGDATEEYLEKYHKILDWNFICHYATLSEAFIEKYADKVYWDIISSCQTLSEDFMRKHADKIIWTDISKFQKLTEKFMSDFADKLDWFEISLYQKMSSAFIEKHKDKVHIVRQRFNDFVKDKFVVYTWNELIDKRNELDVYKNFVFSDCDLEKLISCEDESKKDTTIKAEDLFGYRLRKITETALSEPEIEEDIKHYSWQNVVEYQNLSESFLEKHIQKMGLSRIIMYQKISEAFIEKYLEEDKLYYWRLVSGFQKLSNEFIAKHAEKLDWGMLTAHQTNISEELLTKYKDKLDWKYVSAKQMLSDAFIEENADKVTEIRRKYNSCINYEKDIKKFKPDKNFKKRYKDMWKDKKEVTWNDLVQSQSIGDMFWLHSMLETRDTKRG